MSRSTKTPGRRRLQAGVRSARNVPGTWLATRQYRRPAGHRRL